MLPNVSDLSGDRMNTHNNARLTPKGREEMVRAVVDHSLSKAAAARRFNTTSKTVAKWVDRFNAQGLEGLRDRSSKPHSLPSQIPLATADAVERLRRERRTQEHIAGELGIKHIRTKPYTPQTNGKAERFIQTALREWAYATAFEHSDQRRQALLPFLHRYNWHRPHASLAKKPPISRLGLTSNNLLRFHS